ncbi:hypothetical protein MKEN_01361600 [Mycena kentingensis (nom. inval.)]|nr:hypothetical protein MKEN_01361600 [Mycena kentingensis (nom. inval.)]
MSTLTTSSLFDVQGKIVLVTGGGSGIGKMIAAGFVKNGATVYIAARKEKQLQEAVADLKKLGGGKIDYVVANVGSKAGCDALIAELKKRESKLHVLVNNSGITWGAPYDDFPEEKGWDNVFAVNVKSIFYMTAGLTDYLTKGATADDPGRVINISSTDSIVPHSESLLSGDGNGTWSYQPSKAAVNHLTTQLAVKLGPSQVTVNAILPGFFPSKMTAFGYKTSGDLIAMGQPTGRLGHTEDMAGVALFLASPAAVHVTGTQIIVDGGARFMRMGIAAQVKLSPPLAQYNPPAATKADLEFAELAIIDLSKMDTELGRRELAAQMCEAMRGNGFAYVINHGWSPEQTARMFDIANFAFEGVSEEEKRGAYAADISTGSYQGYKNRQVWHIDNGVTDQIENLAINHDVTRREHPETLRPFLPEIDRLARHTHFNVLHPVLRMLAMGLELPEETFVNIHPFKSPYSESETHPVSRVFFFCAEPPISDDGTKVTFMKYHPRSEVEEEKTNNVWIKGHTDIGVVTVLYSQPIAALQILGRDKKWRWVKHMDNAMVINIGDCMEFFSGGYYKATVHRVVRPPPDQRDIPRLGIFYFTYAYDNLRLAPYVESPVLRRVGIVRREGLPECKEHAPTMRAWRQSRTRTYGTTLSKLRAVKGANGNVQEETIEGVVVQHFN